MNRRIEVSPAAIGSVALHVGVAVVLMVQWGSRDLKVGSVVPVTIVSSAPDRDTRPAEQAETAQSAQAEEVAPETPPQPAPPPPTPAPAPPPKTPPPKPAEKTPAPTPTKPTPPAPAKPAQKSLDLDNLYASLTKPARNAPSAAPTRGPARAETAPVARQTPGTGLASGAAVQGMIDELQRRWNPNCGVEGGNEIVVKTTFDLGATGYASNVETRVNSLVINRNGDGACLGRTDRQCIVQVAADRAARAVLAASPFRGLPANLYGQRMTVNFDAREACR